MQKSIEALTKSIEDMLGYRVISNADYARLIDAENENGSLCVECDQLAQRCAELEQNIEALQRRLDLNKINTLKPATRRKTAARKEA